MSNLSNTYYFLLETAFVHAFSSFKDRGQIRYNEPDIMCSYCRTFMIFFANLTSFYDNDVLNFYVFANESISFMVLVTTLLLKKILFAKTQYIVIH